jgi:threonine synthase
MLAPMSSLLAPLSSEEIDAARARIAPHALRTPLVRSRDGTWLKLECLQPFGSYKIRGATNVLLARSERGEISGRVVSASAGNFGQALTAAAAHMGWSVSIHVPDNAGARQSRGARSARRARDAAPVRRMVAHHAIARRGGRRMLRSSRVRARGHRGRGDDRS